jgi:cephalosporin hydroxylase
MTDKYKNGLIEIYEYHFSRFKDKPIRFLEVGVFHGDSLDYFANYFTHKNTEIIGVDIKLPEKRNDKRITMLEMNQRDTALGGLGMFDIILDDASHEAHLTRETFDILWSCVKPGGLYVIEDWHGSVLPDMEDLVIQIMKSGISSILYKNNKPLGATALFRKEEV